MKIDYTKLWIRNLKNALKNERKLNKKTSFLICPPPNLTGRIHVGHLLEFAIIDFKSRISFVLGEKKIFPLIGFDHAGLYAEILSRNYLIENNFECNKNNILHDIIKNRKLFLNYLRDDIRKFGLLYIGKQSFTFDNTSKNIVQQKYNDLLKNKIIFNDLGLVNWDTKLKTAISDLEVEYIKCKKKIYFLKYFMYENEDIFIEVATTRPETIFGDVALVVNPKDSRYFNFHNKYFLIPIIGKKIPLICSNNVDMTFGSGVLKITPCHDKNDFQITKKENINFDKKNLINEHGKIIYGPYKGLDIKIARDKIIDILKPKNLEIESIIPINARTGNDIECLLIDQVYLDINRILNNIKNKIKEIKIYPDNIYNIIDKYIENSSNWCISRNSFYGHKISKNISLINKSFVLDTWFSSALWPFIILEKNKNILKEHDEFYLVVGKDIIFFWVLKMISLYNFYNSKNLFFNKIMCHGLVCDETGNKISKSKNNSFSIDEILNSHIENDAFRMSVLSCSTSSDKIILDNSHIIKSRRNITKLSNINDFILKLIENSNYSNLSKQNLFKKVYYKHLNEISYNIINKIIDILNKFNINESCVNNYVNNVYNLIWDDISNILITVIKKEHNNKNSIINILIIWNIVLRLIHPFQPFSSEKYYKNIFNKQLFFDITKTKKNIKQILNDIKYCLDKKFNKSTFILELKIDHKLAFITSDKNIITGNILNITNIDNVEYSKKVDIILFGKKISIFGVNNFEILCNEIKKYKNECKNLKKIILFTNDENVYKKNLLKNKLKLNKQMLNFLNKINNLNNFIIH